ncbi:LUD domain-containing protein [Deferribacteraceae bacterium V6Fe1]|nr:LUD domain-containing protein [Deferribacteraceae bacterium V6Fe1]
MKIKQAVKKKLNDKILYTNLKNFASNYKLSRQNALSGLDFLKLRNDIYKSKDFSKEEILALFEEFKQHVEKSGCTVLHAEDGLAANRLITQICKKHNAEYVVKSKSMTSEEIKLNHYLEKQGLKPIETDLGEWILQIAGEHPSHMVMPAIHKTRQQVAKIFEKHTGEKIDPDDIDKMVKIARKYLREYYFKATVGITGANIAVASTGTIGIVTNEGNARLSSTVPPVHIVLVGYEKLVKNFSDAMKIIRLLPKSATGQNISTYVTWIKGSNPSFKSDTGNKHTYYIFLDNGRLSFFEHPFLKDALKCIRCGSCANVCPAYEMVGGHVFGDIYIGAIGLILTSMLHDEKKAKEILTLCIGCKACSFNCPAGIDLQSIISDLNVYMGKKYFINPVKKFVYSAVMKNPSVFKTAMKAAAFIQKPMLTETKENLKNLPYIPKEHNFRKLPSIKTKTFSELFKEKKLDEFKSSKKVFFYPGCAVEYFFPEIGVSMVELLQKTGYQVDIPKTQVCCGLPAIHAGDGQSGKKTILKNIKYMGNPDEYEAFLVLCPSCGMAIKEDFKKYTLDYIAEFKKSEKIGKKVMSFANFLKIQNIGFQCDGNIKYTYHTPCHQGRGLGFMPEEFLKEIFGQNFIPLKDSDVCCGFGGSFSVDYPGISSGILDKKIENILNTKADCLLTDCPGCIMQIDGGLKQKGINVKVKHLSQILNDLKMIKN